MKVTQGTGRTEGRNTRLPLGRADPGVQAMQFLLCKPLAVLQGDP